MLRTVAFKMLAGFRPRRVKKNTNPLTPLLPISFQLVNLFSNNMPNMADY
jgi:hypothetical protein